MTIKELIHQEIEEIPDFLLSEVLDYLQFLKSKHLPKNLEITQLSESALAKDWLKLEEDEAWKNL